MNDPYRIPAEPQPDANWRANALCSQIDSEMFFPDQGGSIKEAKRICNMCDVRLECLQDARDKGELFGIRGGLSPRERNRLNRPVRLAASPRVRTPAELPAGLTHGTRGGYNAGCGCRPCCAADGWYQKQRQKQRGNYGGAA